MPILCNLKTLISQETKNRFILKWKFPELGYDFMLLGV